MILNEFMYIGTGTRIVCKYKVAYKRQENFQIHLKLIQI